MAAIVARAFRLRSSQHIVLAWQRLAQTPRWMSEILRGDLFEAQTSARHATFIHVRARINRQSQRLRRIYGK